MSERNVAEGPTSIYFPEKQAGEMKSATERLLKAHTSDIWKVVCSYSFSCYDRTKLMR